MNVVDVIEISDSDSSGEDFCKRQNYRRSQIKEEPHKNRNGSQDISTFFNKKQNATSSSYNSAYSKQSSTTTEKARTLKTIGQKSKPQRSLQKSTIAPITKQRISIESSSSTSSEEDISNKGACLPTQGDDATDFMGIKGLEKVYGQLFYKGEQIVVPDVSLDKLSQKKIKEWLIAREHKSEENSILEENNLSPSNSSTSLTSLTDLKNEDLETESCSSCNVVDVNKEYWSMKTLRWISKSNMSENYTTSSSWLSKKQRLSLKRSKNQLKSSECSSQTSSYHPRKGFKPDRPIPLESTDSDTEQCTAKKLRTADPSVNCKTAKKENIFEMFGVKNSRDAVRQRKGAKRKLPSSTDYSDNDEVDAADIPGIAKIRNENEEFQADSSVPSPEMPEDCQDSGQSKSITLAKLDEIEENASSDSDVPLSKSQVPSGRRLGKHSAPSGSFQSSFSSFSVNSLNVRGKQEASCKKRKQEVSSSQGHQQLALMPLQDTVYSGHFDGDSDSWDSDVTLPAGDVTLPAGDVTLPTGDSTEDFSGDSSPAAIILAAGEHNKLFEVPTLSMNIMEDCSDQFSDENSSLTKEMKHSEKNLIRFEYSSDSEDLPFISLSPKQNKAKSVPAVQLKNTHPPSKLTNLSSEIHTKKGMTNSQGMSEHQQKNVAGPSSLSPTHRASGALTDLSDDMEMPSQKSYGNIKVKSEPIDQGPPIVKTEPPDHFKGFSKVDEIIMIYDSDDDILFNDFSLTSIVLSDSEEEDIQSKEMEAKSDKIVEAQSKLIRLSSHETPDDILEMGKLYGSPPKNIKSGDMQPCTSNEEYEELFNALTQADPFDDYPVREEREPVIKQEPCSPPRTEPDYPVREEREPVIKQEPCSLPRTETDYPVREEREPVIKQEPCLPPRTEPLAKEWSTAEVAQSMKCHSEKCPEVSTTNVKSQYFDDYATDRHLTEKLLKSLSNILKVSHVAEKVLPQKLSQNTVFRERVDASVFKGDQSLTTGSTDSGVRDKSDSITPESMETGASDDDVYIQPSQPDPSKLPLRNSQEKRETLFSTRVDDDDLCIQPSQPEALKLAIERGEEKYGTDHSDDTPRLRQQQKHSNDDTSSDEDNPYFASTQVDSSVVSSRYQKSIEDMPSEEDDDLYFQATQLDSKSKASVKPNKPRYDPYYFDSKESDSDEESPDDLYKNKTKLNHSSTVLRRIFPQYSEGNRAVRDDHNQIKENNHGSVKDDDEPPDRLISSPYFAKNEKKSSDNSVTEKSPPVVLGGQRYHQIAVPGIPSLSAPVERAKPSIAVPIIEAKPMKTRKEIRHEASISKKFYSSKQSSRSEKTKKSVKTNLRKEKQSSCSTSGWLSKSLQQNCNKGKRSTAGKKGSSYQPISLTQTISAAKCRMYERSIEDKYMHQESRTEASRNAQIEHAVEYDTDVQPPDDEEVMRMGLPLLQPLGTLKKKKNSIAVEQRFSSRAASLTQAIIQGIIPAAPKKSSTKSSPEDSNKKNGEITQAACASEEENRQSTKTAKANQKSQEEHKTSQENQDKLSENTTSRSTSSSRHASQSRHSSSSKADNNSQGSSSSKRSSGSHSSRNSSVSSSRSSSTAHSSTHNSDSHRRRSSSYSSRHKSHSNHHRSSYHSSKHDSNHHSGNSSSASSSRSKQSSTSHNSSSSRPSSDQSESSKKPTTETPEGSSSDRSNTLGSNSRRSSGQSESSKKPRTETPEGASSDRSNTLGSNSRRSSGQSENSKKPRTETPEDRSNTLGSNSRQKETTAGSKHLDKQSSNPSLSTGTFIKPTTGNILRTRSTNACNIMALPVADVCKTTEDSMYSFLNKILKWNVSWLAEQEKTGEAQGNVLPPVVDFSRVFPLCESYDSYSDYSQIFTPLLILETWEVVYRHWVDQSRKIIFPSVIDQVHLKVDKENKLMRFSWLAVVSREQASNRVLSNADIVIVSMKTVAPGQDQEIVKVFGYVESSKILPSNYVAQAIQHKPALQKFLSKIKNSPNLLKFEVLTRYRKIKPEDTQMDIELVGSVLTNVRQYQAMLALPSSPLAKDILRPSHPAVFTDDVVRARSKVKQSQLNDSQQLAVNMAAHLCLQASILPRLAILQGPPGTGKSHTIIELIKNIKQESKGQARILLCAPSNSAVDELTKRLMYERGVLSKQGKSLNFVRVGRSNSILEDVKRFSLHELVRNMKRKAAAVGSNLQTLKTEIHILEAKINSLNNMIISLPANSEKAASVLQDIRKLCKRKEAMEKSMGSPNAEQENIQMTPEEEFRYKRKLLLGADVVCCTLSGVGSHSIMDLIPKARMSDARRSPPPHFTCVIVDEATQCTELDCLMPLQCGITKMVLVGDPEQLPATVLSKKAEEHMFRLSLFERLFRYLQFWKPEDDMILFLDTQYRMDEEICDFPNKYVYNNRLKTDKSVSERCQNFPLKPYLVFDLQCGREVNPGTGVISNPEEAKFIVELCLYLVENARLRNGQIGIITPYQKQRSLLRERLNRRRISVEVGTVDGFQGREKDVIVLSCVRAKSESGGIGFLGNKQRLNVALTRAKHSLFIVGCVESLTISEEWRALMKNAESRRKIVTVSSPKDFHRFVQRVLKHN